MSDSGDSSDGWQIAGIPVQGRNLALFGHERHSIGKYANVKAWPVFGPISRPSTWCRIRCRCPVSYKARIWPYFALWCSMAYLAGPVSIVENRAVFAPRMLSSDVWPVETLGRWLPVPGVCCRLRTDPTSFQASRRPLKLSDNLKVFRLSA